MAGLFTRRRSVGFPGANLVSLGLCYLTGDSQRATPVDGLAFPGEWNTVTARKVVHFSVSVHCTNKKCSTRSAEWLVVPLTVVITQLKALFSLGCFSSGFFP